uniref:Uncharacterized protein n=1 Tax=Toxoplasma gondii COUG TaxID=1074873 RepID=A0A2G8XTJ3_TOXGO|nr:hypothetical protein TGCOUG_311640 [Toxoplasma gondii COUG]
MFQSSFSPTTALSAICLRRGAAIQKPLSPPTQQDSSRISKRCYMQTFVCCESSVILSGLSPLIRFHRFASRTVSVGLPLNCVVTSNPLHITTPLSEPARLFAIFSLPCKSFSLPIVTVLCILFRFPSVSCCPSVPSLRSHSRLVADPALSFPSDFQHRKPFQSLCHASRFLSVLRHRLLPILQICS